MRFRGMIFADPARRICAGAFCPAAKRPSRRSRRTKHGPSATRKPAPQDPLGPARRLEVERHGREVHDVGLLHGVVGPVPAPPRVPVGAAVDVDVVVNEDGDVAWQDLMFLVRVLPVPLYDWLCDFFGISRSMDDFRRSIEQAWNWVLQNLYWILPLAVALLLIALALALGLGLLYSHTKRFTWASHLFLGLAIGAALGMVMPQFPLSVQAAAFLGALALSACSSPTPIHPFGLPAPQSGFVSTIL